MASILCELWPRRCSADGSSICRVLERAAPRRLHRGLATSPRADRGRRLHDRNRVSFDTAPKTPRVDGSGALLCRSTEVACRKIILLRRPIEEASRNRRTPVVTADGTRAGGRDRGPKRCRARRHPDAGHIPGWVRLSGQGRRFGHRGDSGTVSAVVRTFQPNRLLALPWGRIAEPVSRLRPGVAYSDNSTRVDAFVTMRRWSPRCAAGLADPLSPPFLHPTGTDGSLTSVSATSAHLARPHVLTEIGRAFEHGSGAYVISRRRRAMRLQGDLNQVANVGVGRAPHSTFPSFSATLRGAFRPSVGPGSATPSTPSSSSVLQIAFRLDPTRACRRSAEHLPCEDPNGGVPSTPATRFR